MNADLRFALELSDRAGEIAIDYPPMMLIAQEAGGRFTELAGRHRFDSGNALVTNGAVHEQALAVLDEYPVAMRSDGA